MEPIGPVQPAHPGEIFTGMAYDDSSGVMYVVGTDSLNSWLYTITLTTGQLSLIGVDSVGIGFSAIANLGAVYAGPENQRGLYGIDVKTRQLIKISKTTGQGSVVGNNIYPKKLSLKELGMDYSAETNRLYVIITTRNKKVSSELSYIDLTTGKIIELQAIVNGRLGYLALHDLDPVPQKKVCVPPPPEGPGGPTNDYFYEIPANTTFGVPFDGNYAMNQAVYNGGNPLTQNIDIKYDNEGTYETGRLYIFILL